MINVAEDRPSDTALAALKGNCVSTGEKIILSIDQVNGTIISSEVCESWPSFGLWAHVGTTGDNISLLSAAQPTMVVTCSRRVRIVIY